jgi:hypothetical protein
MAATLEQADLKTCHSVQPAVDVLPLSTKAGIGAEQAHSHGIDVEPATRIVIQVFEPDADHSHACHSGEEVCQSADIRSKSAGPARQLRLQSASGFLGRSAGHQAGGRCRHHRGKFVPRREARTTIPDRQTYCPIMDARERARAEALQMRDPRA